jgi:hypothetical protein
VVVVVVVEVVAKEKDFLSFFFSQSLDDDMVAPHYHPLKPPMSLCVEPQGSTRLNVAFFRPQDGKFPS